MITVYHFEPGSLQVNTVFVCLGGKFFRYLSSPSPSAPSYPYPATHPQQQPYSFINFLVGHQKISTIITVHHLRFCTASIAEALESLHERICVH